MMKIVLLICGLIFAASSVEARAVNAAGLELIKHFEGFYSKFYKDPVGIRTIGYGHACHVNDCSKIHEPISEAEATKILIQDLADNSACVDNFAKGLDDDKFAALISFVFNLGCNSLHTSTLGAKVKAHDYKGAAAEFGKWVHAGGKVLPGLVKRREAERALFCKSGGC